MLLCVPLYQRGDICDRVWQLCLGGFVIIVFRLFLVVVSAVVGKVALWSRVRLFEFVLTHVTILYRLREGLESSRSRLEPDASLLPADSISVRLARSAHLSPNL